MKRRSTCLERFYVRRRRGLVKSMYVCRSGKDAGPEGTVLWTRQPHLVSQWPVSAKHFSHWAWKEQRRLRIGEGCAAPTSRCSFPLTLSAEVIRVDHSGGCSSFFRRRHSFRFIARASSDEPFSTATGRPPALISFVTDLECQWFCSPARATRRVGVFLLVSLELLLPWGG